MPDKTVLQETLASALSGAENLYGEQGGSDVRILVSQIVTLSRQSDGVNRLHNSNFSVNQRIKSGTVTLAAGEYGHDRWKAGASGCTYTFATGNGITTLTISAGSLIQVVEGLNLQSSNYTLSWAGTAQGRIAAGSYSASGITSAVTGGTNTNVEFGVGSLSTPKFEIGNVATLYILPDVALELERCHRFLRVYGGQSSYEGIGVGLSGSTTTANLWFPFTTSMRAAPVLSYSAVSDWQVINGASAITATALSIATNSTEGPQVQATVSSGLTVGYASRLQAAATTAARLIFSAEL